MRKGSGIGFVTAPGALGLLYVDRKNSLLAVLKLLIT